MSSITYDELVGQDPTDSFLFKAVMFLNQVQRRVRFGLLVEATRLSFLGFYDDFVKFAEALDEAEGRSQNAPEFDRVWECRLHAAGKIEKLIACFEPLRGARYGGRDLVDYIIGDERLDQLAVFAQATRLDEQAESVIARAKGQFLSTFATRKLNRAQRSALLDKYRELVER
jgi:hypothetical protein